MVGATLSVPWRIVRATAAHAVHVDTASTLHETALAAAVKPDARLELSVAIRRRPFVQMADTLAVDDQAFYSAGPGGATRLAAAWPLTVDELRLGAKGGPTRWSYVYADARGMKISDGNRGWTVSAGAGASVMAIAGADGPLDVTARWDTWYATYSEVQAAYYSPDDVVSHSPGVEIRFRRPAFELAGEGGVTFAPGQSFTGTFAGGSGILRLGRVSVVARAQARRDPWYASRRGWIAIQTEL